jgi:hypothetical protein
MAELIARWGKEEIQDFRSNKTAAADGGRDTVSRSSRLSTRSPLLSVAVPRWIWIE